MNISNLWRIPFDIGQFFADNVERTVLAQQLAERGAYPTDQIAQFFEDEYDVQYRPFLPAAMVESVDQLKVRYLNCRHAVDFNSEQIAMIIQQIVQAKEELSVLLRKCDDLERSVHGCHAHVSNGERAAQLILRERMAEQRLLLANYKLDLSDRKTKRFFKQKERALLAPECAAAIGEVKLGLFIPEATLNGQRLSSGSESATAHTHAESDALDGRSASHGSRPSPNSSASLRRRCAHKPSPYISDDEIASLLRDVSVLERRF